MRKFFRRYFYMMNILIIWLWYHARRIYLPTLFTLKNKFKIHKIIGIDNRDISEFDDLREIYPDLKIKILWKNLSFKNFMNSIKKEFSPDAIIISTDPLNHYQYMERAIKNNIHILTDKPIILEKDIISSEISVNNLKKKTNHIIKLYKLALERNENLLCEVMCQRRFHKWYQLAKEKVLEIFHKTNCPITYITTFHSDGQRRFPDEIINQDYHPYNQWYGKVWHSWYHTIDIVSWFVASTNNSQKNIDNIEVYSQTAFPKDIIHQFNIKDYKSLFSNFIPWYSQDSYIEKFHGFWDVDNQISIGFKKWNFLQTIASINLLHNWFWQRNRIDTKGKDLYKGNWRIRQEFLMIEQGPFQSIFIESFQSSEINKSDKDLYNNWWEHHFDIHIYRNDSMFPDLRKYEKVSIWNLYKDFSEWYSRWHNENARRDGVEMFLQKIQDKQWKTVSNLLDHTLSLTIFNAIYKTINNRNLRKLPLVHEQYKWDSPQI